MNKTFVILSLFLTCIISSNAQSDATLEETIQWINLYGLKGNGVSIRESDGSGSEYTQKWALSNDNTIIFNIENMEKVFGTDYIEETNTMTAKWQLSEITRIICGPADYVLGYHVTLIISGQNLTYWDVHFQKSENAERLFSALKHLCSFFEYEIKFGNMITLENKF